MSNRRTDAFQRALDEAGRKDRASNDDGPGPSGRPRVRGVAFGAAPGSGGRARFGLALDWTDEPTDRPAPPPQPPPRDGARPSRGRDARPAYVPLAQFRLAQSSRSPAPERPRARQCSGGDRQHALRWRATGARQAAIAIPLWAENTS